MIFYVEAVGGPMDGQRWEVEGQTRTEIVRMAHQNPFTDPPPPPDGSPNIQRGTYRMELAPDGTPVCTVDADGTVVIRLTWEGWTP